MATRIDTSALGPPDPRRAFFHRQGKKFEREMDKITDGPPPHPPGSLADRRQKGQASREELRQFPGTGLGAGRTW